MDLFNTVQIYLRNTAHINILEYLAQIISAWIDILEGRVRSEDCILSIGGNTSLLGWMRKTNFRQKRRVKQVLGSETKIGKTSYLSHPESWHNPLWTMATMSWQHRSR